NDQTIVLVHILNEPEMDRKYWYKSPSTVANGLGNIKRCSQRGQGTNRDSGSASRALATPWLCEDKSLSFLATPSVFPARGCIPFERFWAGYSSHLRSILDSRAC